MKTDDFSITEVDEDIEKIMMDLKKTGAGIIKNRLLIVISVVNIFWTGIHFFFALIAIYIILEIYHSIFHIWVDKAKLNQSIAKKEMFTVIQKLLGINTADHRLYSDQNELTKQTINIDLLNQMVVEKGLMAANVAGCSHFFSEFLIFGGKTFILWFAEYLIAEEHM
jgi:spermidine/putrescine-binding protein